MMIYSTTNKMRATYIKGMLEEAKILVVLLNNTIEPYGEGMMGEILLYVHYQQAEEAIDFIYNLPE